MIWLVAYSHAMQESISVIVNFVLSAIGFLATLTLGFAPLGALVLGILWFFETNKKRKSSYGRWALIAVASGIAAVFLILVVLGSFATVNTIFS